ncbi:hypothetical protein SAMN06265379_10153 [Saccharicrinis carchari]|uniref:Uncharacterized protein n=2 Tax=Saccharicrinis carchari TaxID=1168039 RepID=A0A521ADA1_SACCC|nr:hypothetical protein SAMN06265379_10153 [Saccharicrinis carchari]
MYARTLGVLPSIYIREWDVSSYRVYSTTIHELAHAAHWDMDRGAFRELVKKAYDIPTNASNSKSYVAVIESWPEGVEWYFTTNRYKKYLNQNSFVYMDNYQYRILPNYSSDDFYKTYTSIIIDLMDNFNQSVKYGRWYPVDRVKGYTIKQIESALKGARSWNKFRDRIKNINSSNNDDDEIDELFANWHK